MKGIKKKYTSNQVKAFYNASLDVLIDGTESVNNIALIEQYAYQKKSTIETIFQLYKISVLLDMPVEPENEKSIKFSERDILNFMNYIFDRIIDNIKKHKDIKLYLNYIKCVRNSFTFQFNKYLNDTTKKLSSH